MTVPPRLMLMLLVCGLPLFPQAWDALQGLQAGDRIKVLDNAGQELKGAFTAVSAESISLKSGNRDAAIERLRVRRVQLRSSSRRVRNILIGVGVGLAVGVTVDQTVGTYLRNETGESGRALTYVAPIALFGGIAAALPTYRTVYRVRGP